MYHVPVVGTQNAKAAEAYFDILSRMQARFATVLPLDQVTLKVRWPSRHGSGWPPSGLTRRDCAIALLSQVVEALSATRPVAFVAACMYLRKTLPWCSRNVARYGQCPCGPQRALRATVLTAAACCMLL